MEWKRLEDCYQYRRVTEKRGQVSRKKKFRDLPNILKDLGPFQSVLQQPERNRIYLEL